MKLYPATTLRRLLVRNAVLAALPLGAAALSTSCSNSPGSTSSGGNGGSAGTPSGTGGISNGTGATGGTGVTAGQGGTSSSGGSAGAVSAECPNVAACGGSIVGTWNVTSSCLRLVGNMDVTLASLGCATVPVTGSLTTKGSYTVNPDGSYVDATTTTGSVTFPLSPACLTISSVAVSCEKAAGIFTALGWATSVCTDTNGQCSCSLTANQAGGLGLISPVASTHGADTTAGNTFTNDDGLTYSYCVASNTLTVTPQMAALAGTIALQSGTSSGGAGGGAGTGGASPTGGGPGSGGAGGMPPAGGASGSGGSGGGSMGGAAGHGGVATGGSGGGSSGTGGSGGSAGVPGTGMGPCDIYAAANTPCVAAHSTIRALYGAYAGNLYQVKRADGMTKDIPVASPGGFADSAQQDSFCSGTQCTITKLYDQSGHDNFLEAETPDSTVGGHSGQTAASATAESLMVDGHKVYSLYTKSSQAYWRDGSKSGMPLASAPQGIYIVTSGKHFNSGCCYDYGNGETSRTYVAGPSMDSLYFGSSTTWGTGNGAGPWVMADMEDGMVAQGGSGKNNNLMSQTSTYVTAMEKNNGTTEFALKAADATAPTLNTYYKGALPPGKNPMKKQGSIVLGSGGDCCYSNNNASQGTFYEGAIVAGYPSDTTDNAVHANIVSTNYGK
jgi:hypothetical protein